MSDLYKNKQNCIEPQKFQFTEFDDTEIDSLLLEMEKAQQLWEKEKEIYPEEAKTLEQSADQQFDQLMERLYEEGKTPVKNGACFERQEVQKPEPEEKKRNGRSWNQKVFKRAVMTMAVLGLFFVRGGIHSVARNGYRFIVYPEEKKENVLIISNTNIQFSNDRLDDAYDWISQNLDIPVLMTFYMPDGMNFLEFEDYERYGLIKFDYKGKIIYLRESKLMETDNISFLLSDRKNYHQIRNDWLDQDLTVKENFLENGIVEYSVVIDNDKGVYYLTGVMEKEEFDQISENLIYR